MKSSPICYKTSLFFWPHLFLVALNCHPTLIQLVDFLANSVTVLSQIRNYNYVSRGFKKKRGTQLFIFLVCISWVRALENQLLRMCIRIHDLCGSKSGHSWARLNFGTGTHSSLISGNFYTAYHSTKRRTAVGHMKNSKASLFSDIGVKTVKVLITVTFH